MPDVIARAEEFLAHFDEQPGRYVGARGVIRELITELKTAREQLERRRIETVDELKQLKPRPDLINGVLIRAFGVPAFGGVFELNDDGTWNDYDSEDPSGERTPPEAVPLPAIVIWAPDAADDADA
ncbi:hypothetical protein [Mycobacterium intracellulare]|uniref:hypothetical protein n=1 Tax=Mycobacterium intracellulare TaxID=1767 RepID=UPI00080B1253|nr:hypothetical protein [Mycobacterium intracellulare]OCB15109.1 hypothetical protein A5689_27020 [Mycobacterium intracellulare subsp. yongonense]